MVQAGSTRVTIIVEVDFEDGHLKLPKLIELDTGRFETLPYDRSTIRSTYHTREYDIARLSMLPLVSAWPTVVLSHDWPLEIERFGDTAGLIRRKPFFKEEVLYITYQP